MSQALIQRNDAALTVSYTAEAVALRESALALSGVVGKVSNADDNQAAVSAQSEIHKVRTLAEKARKAAKEPVLEYGKRIDAAAKAFVEELDEEMLRISKLIGDFQTLEQQKARAAEQLRSQELAKIEREKSEALSKVTSHDQADAIQAHFAEQAQQTATVAPVAPIRAEGQVVRQVWKITFVDVIELARFRPDLVNITPRTAEIKSALSAGQTIRGVKAELATEASVRVSTKQSVISV